MSNLILEFVFVSAPRTNIISDLTAGPNDGIVYGELCERGNLQRDLCQYSALFCLGPSDKCLSSSKIDFKSHITCVFCI